MKKIDLKELFRKVVYNPNKAYDKLQSNSKSYKRTLRFSIFMSIILLIMLIGGSMQVVLLILLLAYRISYFHLSHLYK